MIDKDQASKIVKRRPKRNFSDENKKKFYSQWKASGLKKSQFCKENDLVLSAFAKWCRTLASEKIVVPTQNDWVPVISTNRLLEKENLPTLIEIKISSKTKFCILSLFIIVFLKEFLYAINIIW